MIDLSNLSSPALPLDVWIDILSRLPFAVLKRRVERLNSSFRTLLLEPALADSTFRGKPNSPKAKADIARGGPVLPHPILSHLMWEGADPVSKTLVDTIGGDLDRSKGLVLLDLKERLDKATSPAVDRLALRLVGFEPDIRDSIVEARDGVTVWDVLKETFKVLNEGMPAPYCPMCVRFHMHSELDSQGEEYLGVFSRDGCGLVKKRPKSEVETSGWDSYAAGLWCDGEIYTTDAKCRVSKGRVVLVLELNEPDYEQDFCRRF